MKNIKINFLLFPLLTIFFWVLIFVTFIAAAAEDEGTNGTNVIGIILAKLFYIFRFPTHNLLWEFMTNDHMSLYFPGLMLNGLFYAFITERIISFVSNKKHRFNK